MEDKENRSSDKLGILKKMLTRDVHWKLLSLAAAIFAWILVMNTINPTEIKSFNTLLSFENMDYLTDNGYVVSNLEQFENYGVMIKVEATRPALDELSRESNRTAIKAKIDLSKIDLGSDDVFPKSVPIVITPSLPNNIYGYNYEISSYYPTMCEVQIDRARSKTVNVELRSTGSPAVGYSAGKPTGSVNRVKITGPENKVSQVEKAVAVIDISAQKSDITGNCTLTAYDGEDNALSGFVIEPASVPVSINIRRNTTVSVDPPETTGALAPHLQLGTIEYSPNSVRVTTASEDAPKSITLPPVDISSITETTSYAVDISDILKNAGLEPADSSQSTISVTVNVSVKDSREYNIPASDISLRGLGQGLSAVLPENITADIGGADVDVASLAPFVDLTGLGEGEHEVPLVLNVPPNAALKEEVRVKVNITSGAAENNTEQQNETEENTDETAQ